VTYIEGQLERAAEDDHVKAVILKIDSPGGEVLASDAIYKLLQDFQEEHDKPVVATMGTVAASGGYYIAAPCRWIVANELTITGSIGVIMQSYNWRGLMDKVGIQPQVFKSGVMKDMLSPNKREEDITPEERRIVQDLVAETFERFKSIVEEGRGVSHAHNEDNKGEAADQGRELSGNWKDFADGRLLSGKDAWKLGFVDELGDFSAAVQRTYKLTGIREARLIQYLRPVPFGSLFRLLGRSEESRVSIDLGIAMPKLRSGLYFLAPELVR
jgi:protease-4